MTQPQPSHSTMHPPTPATYPDPDEDADLVTELTRAALANEANSHTRGSRSMTYEACTRHFVTVLAKEVMFLSQMYRRPEMKITYCAGKALAAVQAAITEIDETNQTL